jgi:DNA-binding transcriptional LysR family regulator
MAARRHIRQGALTVLLADWSSGRQPLNAVFAGGRHVPARIRAFVEFAQTVVAGQSAS